MKRLLAHGAATSQGAWPVLEDAFVLDPGVGLFALANGFGGKDIGDRAAAQVIQSMQEKVHALGGEEQETVLLKFRSELSDQENQIRNVVGVLNKDLYEANRERSLEQRGGVSLLGVLLGENGDFVIGNLGSNGAVIFRSGEALSIANPNSFFANRAQIVGGNSDLGGSDFPIHALGMFAGTEPEVKSSRLEAGDLLVLYTDSFIAGKSELLQKSAQLAADFMQNSDNHNNIKGLAEKMLELENSSENSCLRNRSVLLIHFSDSSLSDLTSEENQD